MRGLVLPFWSTEMTDWGRLLIRFFGVLHLIYGGVGTLFLVQSFLRVFQDSARLHKYPYERQIFYVDIILEVFFVGALVVAGLWLIRLSRRGVILSNYIF